VILKSSGDRDLRDTLANPTPPLLNAPIVP
jgi:hypothetical protein